MNKITFSLTGRIWVNSDGLPFAGKGKIELLEKIKESGNLTKAATELKIPYRQAWDKVQAMNKAYDSPVVVFKHGGKEHGYTNLTEFGEKIIFTYRRIEADFEKFLAEQSEKLNSEINRE